MSRRVDHLLALVVAVPLLTAAAISRAGPAARRPAAGPRRGRHRGGRVRRRHARGHHGPHGRRGSASTGSAGSARPAESQSASTSRPGPLSAGLACLAAVLVTASMIFSWRYFQPGGHLLPRAHADLPGGHDRLLPHRRHLRPVRMVRADGGGGLRPDRLPARGERGSLQGALNFAITNSIGAYLSLSGIGVDLRPHRRAEHGPDRCLHRPSSARRAGHGGVPARSSPVC